MCRTDLPLTLAGSCITRTLGNSATPHIKITDTCSTEVTIRMYWLFPRTNTVRTATNHTKRNVSPTSKITVYSTANDLSYKTCGLETKLLLSQSGNQRRKNIKKTPVNQYLLLKNTKQDLAIST